MRHNKVIQHEFSKQAASFGDQGLTLSSQEILDWIVESLPLVDNMRVLDVAAGTGHLSRGIAPHVKEVVAIDITPEMLAQARKESAAAGLENIQIDEGNAEKLPYEDDSFDLVVSRLAVHHFEEPARQLKEMVRVCKPNHQVGIIDLLSPEDLEVAAVYNRLEKLRDPSHTVALSESQMVTILGDVGIKVDRVEKREIVVDFLRWVEMTQTEECAISEIRTALLKDLSGGPKTGMRPFIQDNALKFYQVWSVMLGRVI